MRVSHYAENLLGSSSFAVAAEEILVDLVKVPVGELGFDVARRKEIYAKAVGVFGFQICPAEVGPQFRLQNKNQPHGERLIVGMEPIIGLNRRPELFVIENSNDLWLRTFCDGTHFYWKGAQHFLFILPRRQ